MLVTANERSVYLLRVLLGLSIKQPGISFRYEAAWKKLQVMYVRLLRERKQTNILLNKLQADHEIETR